MLGDAAASLAAAAGSRNAFSIASPVAPDFSGWNCAAHMLPRATADTNSPPYCVVESTQGLLAAEGVARYECTKYTRLSPTPASSPDGCACVRSFQPMCGTGRPRAGSNLVTAPGMMPSPSQPPDSSLPSNSSCRPRQMPMKDRSHI